MSFPEDENKPSRTIMATRSLSSRESIIYKSEYNRKGDGEFRLPTIREIACLMGFPIVYQFVGGQSSKWEQIGNAIPPFLSSALARTVRLSLGLKPIPMNSINFHRLTKNYAKIDNLNTYSEKNFDKPPKRKNLARFRKHPFKVGNMTVALSNYNPTSQIKVGGKKWYSAVFYSTGKDYVVEILEPNKFKRFERIILDNQGMKGKLFMNEFDHQFQSALENIDRLQHAYENPSLINKEFDPICLIDDIAKFIEKHDSSEKLIHTLNPIAGRKSLPIRQLYAMYAINKLISAQKL